ncbi:hypothetical protein [Corallococcus sp. AS-1-6]|uniref:hypothetical protein n=1 Tax=Corallococcus sp. AS-1-6 TaxID=2874599 RepID=UPI001CC0E361|nr:hypothetical protein [Corallococcus sp. AS-1-6]MBZ4371460.1 hypothetical protein [Corallococcus sp. AS-1-6]
MACPAQQRPDGPLTTERQALARQWMRYARGAARRYCFGRPRLLGHLQDLEAAALLGLVVAAQRWQPERSGFYACARWWVQAALRTYDRRGSRVVPLSQTATHGEAREVPLETRHGGATEDHERLDERVDARLHGQALLDRVTPEVESRLRVAGGRGEGPRRAVQALLAVVLDGTSVGDFAEQRGLQRQGVYVALKKAGAAFESWAAEVRGEA